MFGRVRRTQWTLRAANAVLSQIASDGAAEAADRDAAVTATLLAAGGGEYVGVRSKERLGVLQALLHVVCTSDAFREQLQAMQAAAGAAAAEQVGRVAG